MDVFFFIEDDVLLENSNGVWNKVYSSIKKELDGELCYNKKFLKAKIRYYSGEATNFHDKEVSKVGYNYTYLAVISIDFVLKN